MDEGWCVRVRGGGGVFAVMAPPFLSFVAVMRILF